MQGSHRIVAITLELLLMLGGVVALSGLIVAKKPDAKAILDKLVPFQALIGVGMLGLSIVLLLMMRGGLFSLIKTMPVLGMALLAGVISGIVLGGLFGMPQIAKWIPGESSAEQKATEISQKVAPYQALIGIVAAAAGAIGFLYSIGIMNYADKVGLN